MCTQVVGLGFRSIHCKKIPRVSELVFFTGKYPEGPFSRGVPISNLPVEVGRLDIAVYDRTLEYSCGIKQGEDLAYHAGDLHLPGQTYKLLT